ncbi:MAG: alpha/beta hydrolase [bacterium]|nr:alpha/beta hydrolase [bacterium]
MTLKKISIIKTVTFLSFGLLIAGLTTFTENSFTEYLIVLFCFYVFISNKMIHGKQEKASDVVNNIVEEKFTSVYVRDKYKLHVYLPHSYQDKKLNRKYPVLYVLDGRYLMGLMVNAVESAMRRKIIPEMIIVGINYQGKDMRTRDFTPTNVNQASYETSGGAHIFQKCLTKEILPLIDKKYRTNKKERILFGGSLGGLFCVYSIFTQPDIFSKYIAVSPSLYWNDFKNYSFHNHGGIKLLEENYYKKRKDLPVRLFLSIGMAEKKYMVDNLKEFVKVLEKRDYQGLDYDTMYVPSGTHFSAFYGSIMSGLESVFRNVPEAVDAATFENEIQQKIIDKVYDLDFDNELISESYKLDDAGEYYILQKDKLNADTMNQLWYTLGSINYTYSFPLADCYA